MMMGDGDEQAIESLAMSHRGVFTAAQASRIGIGRTELVRLQREARVVRVRRGAYTTTARWLPADQERRHLLVCRAVLASLTGDAHLTGASALTAYAVPLYREPLAVVDVVRIRSNGRISAGVAHHDGELPECHRSSVDGLRSASPSWAFVQYARSASLEQALVAADGVFRAGLAEPVELREAAARCRGWSGSRGLWAALDRADGRSASVGETRSRLLIEQLGYTRPELQVKLLTGEGRAEVDFLWQEEGLVGEFDGKVKYGRLVPQGSSPADVAWRERRREIGLERGGLVVARWCWSDLEDPCRLKAVLDEGFVRARRLGRHPSPNPVASITAPAS